MISLKAMPLTTFISKESDSCSSMKLNLHTITNSCSYEPNAEMVLVSIATCTVVHTYNVLMTIFSRFSQSCYEDADGEVTCRNCPEGYVGRRCERCDEGYVGNPMIPGSSCRKTQSKDKL